MRAVLGWAGSGAASAAVAEAVARAAQEADAVADLPVPGTEPRIREASADGRPLFFARAAGGVLFGSRARSLLATGLLPRTLDPVGVAAFLWRGAPIASRLWLAGVEAVPWGRVLDLDAGEIRDVASANPAPAAPVPAEALDALLSTDATASGAWFLPTAGRAPSLVLLALHAAAGRPGTAVVARWPGAPPGDGMHDAARAARAAGSGVEVVDFAGCDPERELAALLSATDLPSVDAFGLHLLDGAAERLGAKVVLRATGGAALFLDGPPFYGLSSVRRAVRARAPRHASATDPYDVAAQADDEDRAYRRAPVQRLYARLALLPAATRAALMPDLSRPTDGAFVVKAEDRLDRLSRAAFAVASSHALGEASSRVAVHRPFLRADVAGTAERLSFAKRFGRPGSGGWLARRLRSLHGFRVARPVAGFEGALDLWLRGPLSGWLLERLAPERIRAQGVLSPTAVATVVERFRARAGGIRARALFGLGLLSHALERDGLSRSAS